MQRRSSHRRPNMVPQSAFKQGMANGPLQPGDPLVAAAALGNRHVRPVIPDPQSQADPSTSPPQGDICLQDLAACFSDQLRVADIIAAASRPLHPKPLVRPMSDTQDDRSALASTNAMELPEMNMFCVHCGQQVSAHHLRTSANRFCVYCGKPHPVGSFDMWRSIDKLKDTIEKLQHQEVACKPHRQAIAGTFTWVMMDTSSGSKFHYTWTMAEGSDVFVGTQHGYGNISNGRINGNSVEWNVGDALCRGTFVDDGTKLVDGQYWSARSGQLVGCFVGVRQPGTAQTKLALSRQELELQERIAQEKAVQRLTQQLAQQQFAEPAYDSARELQSVTQRMPGATEMRVAGRPSPQSSAHQGQPAFISLEPPPQPVALPSSSFSFMQHGNVDEGRHADGCSLGVPQKDGPRRIPIRSSTLSTVPETELVDEATGHEPKTVEVVQVPSRLQGC